MDTKECIHGNTEDCKDCEIYLLKSENERVEGYKLLVEEQKAKIDELTEELNVLNKIECQSCGGYGMVGGFVNMENGYDAEQCATCEGLGYVQDVNEIKAKAIEDFCVETCEELSKELEVIDVGKVEVRAAIVNFRFYGEKAVGLLRHPSQEVDNDEK